MRKIRFFMSLVLFIIITLSASLPIMGASANDSPVITFTANDDGAGGITVAAVMQRNGGILSARLELTYDSEALILTDCKRGDALASLDMVTTNADTEKGYSIRPFIILYEGTENDTSVGELFTLHFSVNDKVTDGEYKVSMKHNRDRDVTALDDNAIITKNLLIDSVVISIKESKTSSITVVDNESKSANPRFTTLTVLLVVAAVVCVTAVILIIIRLRSKRKDSWVKL